MSAQPVRLINAVSWLQLAFLSCFAGGLLVITWLFIRDGSRLSTGEWLSGFAFLAFGWPLGLVAWLWAARQQFVTAVLPPGGRVRVTHGPVWRRTTVWLAAGTVTVQQEQDGEGDPYYRVLLAWAGGGPVPVAEGHCPATAERTAALLRQALSQPGS